MGRCNLVGLRLPIESKAVSIAAKLKVIVELAANDNSGNVGHQVHRGLPESQQFALLVPSVAIDGKPRILVQVKPAMRDNIVLSRRKRAINHPDAMQLVAQVFGIGLARSQYLLDGPRIKAVVVVGHIHFSFAQ